MCLSEESWKVLVVGVAGKLRHDLGNDGKMSEYWIVWRHGLLTISECIAILGEVHLGESEFLPDLAFSIVGIGFS